MNLTLALQHNIPTPIDIKYDTHTVQSWSLVRMKKSHLECVCMFACVRLHA